MLLAYFTRFVGCPRVERAPRDAGNIEGGTRRVRNADAVIF